MSKGWGRGEFDIDTANGDRTVYGWIRGCWGIPIRPLAGDPVSKTLTHIPTGRSVSDGLFESTNDLKRLADLLEKRVPELAGCQSVAEVLRLPQERQRAIIDARRQVWAG